MSTEGWHRVERIGLDLMQDAHFYRRVSASPDERIEDYRALCGLEISGQNMDLDISEIPILPICKTCLRLYKDSAR